MKQTPRIILLLLIFRLVSFTVSAQDEVSDYIAENPDMVSVICMQGDETIVSHNEDERSVLASTAKVIILAEYGRQVALGELDPDEAVAITDVELYYIPGSDGDAHPQWLSSLDDDAETATLSQVVDSMMIFSSNAGSDYILSRLEIDGFVELYDLLGLDDTDLPTYFLGNLLVLSNHEISSDSDYVEALDQETFLAEHDRLVDLFVNDADWRAAELDFRDEPQIGLPSIAVQAQYFERFSVQSTAADMLAVIQAPFVASGLSEEAQTVMREQLDWLFDVNPANADVYEALATKGGAYAGVLTSVWYVDAIGLEPVTLVVLYHDLPNDIWLDWLGTSVHQSLELQVVTTLEGCDVFADILPEG